MAKRDKIFSEIKEECKKLEAMDFEDFRDTISLMMEQIYEVQLIQMKFLSKETKKIFNMAADTAKRISHTNDEDFKRAERNFKGIVKTLEHMHERIEKIEGGAIVAYLKAASLGVNMALNGEIPLTHFQDPQVKFESLPESGIDSTAEFYEVPKELIMKSIGREVTG